MKDPRFQPLKDAQILLSEFMCDIESMDLLSYLQEVVLSDLYGLLYGLVDDLDLNHDCPNV